MSYEIPLPMPDELAKNPIRNAHGIHKHLIENGFEPIAVVVDNANAKVNVYFDHELNNEEKKKLFEAVLDYYKKHIGIKEE
jgi:F0F1-type ATP synthase delta subunit